MKYTTYYLLLFGITICNHSFSQTQKVVADKIIAQIGDKIILNSDLDTGACYGINLGKRPECTLLEQLLIEKCLAMEGAKDSIVTESQLETALDEQMRLYVEQYGDEKQLKSATGKNLYELKEQIKRPFTERLLSNKMYAKIVDGVSVSPAEVRTYFTSLPPDSVPLIDETLELNKLVIYPKANKNEIEQLSEQLIVWRNLVKEGRQKFDLLARLYSQDPESNAQGGIYNINKNDGQWDPTWFTAIWKLKDGEISPVVQSEFGLHIIQMVSRAGDDAIIRHIMLIPKVTNTELNDAKKLLDSVRNQVLLGNMTFNTAVNKYNGDETMGKNDDQSIEYDGSIEMTVNDLDNNTAVITRTMQNGQISNPFVYKDDRQRTALAIIFLKRKTPAHKASLETDYNLLAKTALTKKKDTVMHNWLKSHMHDFYVNIDSDFAKCDNTTQWMSPMND